MIICWRIKYLYSFKFYSFFFIKLRTPDNDKKDIIFWLKKYVNKKRRNYIRFSFNEI
jgi:hypothetical protein